MVSNDASSKNNRKNLIKLPKLNKSYTMDNLQSLYSISDLQEDIRIDCESVNLLEFSEGKLEIFTLKLFSKLPYFYNLPHERDEFPNFLRQMHYEYEKNENKFHNFTHAVNGNPMLNFSAAYLLSVHASQEKYIITHRF